MTLIKFWNFYLGRLKKIQRAQWENTNTPCIHIYAKLIYFEVIQSACKQDAFQSQALPDASLTLN